MTSKNYLQNEHYSVHTPFKFQIIQCVREKSYPRFFSKFEKANNSKIYWQISIKLGVQNKHQNMLVPCKFQINWFINKRAVADTRTRTVDDQGTRAVDDQITWTVDDPRAERLMIGWRSMSVDTQGVCALGRRASF